MTKDPLSQSTLGQRVTLTFFDSMMINRAYCEGKVMTKTLSLCPIRKKHVHVT